MKMNPWKVIAVCLGFAPLVLACGSPGTGGNLPPVAAGGQGGAQQSQPPVISGQIDVSPKYLPPGGEGIARVSANAPGQGDKVSYSWSVKGGEIVDGESTPVLRFKAGEKADSVVVKVIVSNTHNQSREQTVTVKTASQFIVVDAPILPVIKKGQTFGLTLSARNVDGLSGLSFRLQFDPGKFELQKVAAQKLMGDLPLVVVDSRQPGIADIALVKTSGDPVKGDGPLGMVSFKALEDYKDTDTPIYTTPGTDDLPLVKAKDGKDLPIAFKVQNLLKPGGEATTVTPPVPGSPDISGAPPASNPTPPATPPGPTSPSNPPNPPPPPNPTPSSPDHPPPAPAPGKPANP